MNSAKVMPQRHEGKKKNWFVTFIRQYQLHLFMLIPIVYIIIFAYIPMFGIQIAFKDFAPGKGIWGSPWVGFKHFITFFNSYQFGRVITNTVRISLYSLIVNFPLPIILALLLNTVRRMRFKKLVQTVTYVPYFLSTVVVVGMLVQFLNPITGVYGNLYRALSGNSGYPQSLMQNPKAFIHLYVWSGVWQYLGWNSIIYIAALSSVDPQLHESAQIDGASRWKRIWAIDLPAIIPTISVLLILNVGSIMSVGFEKVYLMQNNLNLTQSEVISTYVYKVGLTSGLGNFSYATAIGLFNSLINCFMLVVVNALSRKFSEDNTSLW
ncbi:MAG: ABC transporter permease subunit [Clostridiaceae bacterium]|nr:ABC transporter permease subunit [Clostridiaceae bacterium]